MQSRLSVKLTGKISALFKLEKYLVLIFNRVLYTLMMTQMSEYRTFLRKVKRIRKYLLRRQDAHVFVWTWSRVYIISLCEVSLDSLHQYGFLKGIKDCQNRVVYGNVTGETSVRRFCHHHPHKNKQTKQKMSKQSLLEKFYILHYAVKSQLMLYCVLRDIKRISAGN